MRLTLSSSKGCRVLFPLSSEELRKFMQAPISARFAVRACCRACLRGAHPALRQAPTRHSAFALGGGAALTDVAAASNAPQRGVHKVCGVVYFHRSPLTGTGSSRSGEPV